MNDDTRDEQLKHLLEHYNEPPPLPRASLQDSLFGRTDVRTASGRRALSDVPATMALAAAIAMFLLGVGAGLTLERRPGSETAEGMFAESDVPAAERLPAADATHRVVWF